MGDWFIFKYFVGLIHEFKYYSNNIDAHVRPTEINHKSILVINRKPI